MLQGSATVQYGKGTDIKDESNKKRVRQTMPVRPSERSEMPHMFNWTRHFHPYFIVYRVLTFYVCTFYLLFYQFEFCDLGVELDIIDSVGTRKSRQKFSEKRIRLEILSTLHQI